MGPDLLAHSSCALPFPVKVEIISKGPSSWLFLLYHLVVRKKEAKTSCSLIYLKVEVGRGDGTLKTGRKARISVQCQWVPIPS